jgi:hypothetical protein
VRSGRFLGVAVAAEGILFGRVVTKFRPLHPKEA